MSIEIKNIFSLIREDVNNKKYFKALSKLPTNFAILNKYTAYIDLYKSEYHKELVLLFYIIISNPFDINSCLKKDEVEKVISFLESILYEDHVLDKFIYKIFAILIKSNIIKTRKMINPNYKKEINNGTRDVKDELNEDFNDNICHDDEIVITTICDFLKFNLETKRISIKLNKIVFYKTLKELSKILKHDYLGAIEINSNDSILIKRYKIKILSYQNPNLKILSHLLTFLNESNIKVSWTLCKAIFRIMIKLDNIDGVLLTLKNNLKDIFANESLWINTSIIFSFLLLKGHRIENLTFLKKMLFYDNKFESKSEQVRESALFLLWSVIRNNHHYEINILDNIVLMSLLDASLNCRRAAASVLMEYVGKNQVSNAERLTDLINFHTLKRYEQCVEIIPKVIDLLPKTKDSFIENIKIKLFDHNTATNGKYLAFALTKFYNCVCDINVEIRHNINFIIGLSFLLHAFDSKCQDTEYLKFLSKVDLKNLYDNQLFYSMISIYLKVIDILIENKYDVKNNILFLLVKNIETESSAKLARKIDDNNFKKILFTNYIRKNNDAYILSNVFNTDYTDKINDKYINTLKGSDAIKKATIIKALILRKIEINMEKVENFYNIIISCVQNGKEYNSHLNLLENTNDHFLFYILLGLEDYSVYIKGDAGYYVRKNSFLFLYENKLNFLVDKYIVRYFVDKSVQLRHDIFKIANDNEFIGQFKKIFNELEKNSLDEELHFIACFKIYPSLSQELKEEFVLGILSTYKNCDGYVYRFLSKLLIENLLHMKEIIIKFLGLKKRYLFLSLYFVYSLFEYGVEIPEKKEFYTAVSNIENKNDKITSLINMINELNINKAAL